MRTIRALLFAIATVAFMGSAFAADGPSADDGKRTKDAINERAAAALQLILDGKGDKFLDTYYDREMYDNTNTRKSQKRYNIPAAKKRAAPCLKDGKVVVHKFKNDPAKEDSVKVFHKCGDKRMPVPSRWKFQKGNWYVTSYSW